LKHIVLKSARLAFHYALEAFAMGDMDIGEYQTFEDEIN
jgi:hypothetical protein